MYTLHNPHSMDTAHCISVLHALAVHIRTYKTQLASMFMHGLYHWVLHTAVYRRHATHDPPGTCYIVQTKKWMMKMVIMILVGSDNIWLHFWLVLHITGNP